MLKKLKYWMLPIKKKKANKVYQIEEPKQYKKGYQTGEIVNKSKESKDFCKGYDDARKGKIPKTDFDKEYQKLQMLREQYSEQEKKVYDNFEMER